MYGNILDLLCNKTQNQAFGRHWRIAHRINIKLYIMPRKIRELIANLKKAGFYEISSAGKGSHRKYTHGKYLGAVTMSGKLGDDALPYQEKQVKQAIEEVKS